MDIRLFARTASILRQLHYDFSKTIGYDGFGHKTSTGMTEVIEFGKHFSVSEEIETLKMFGQHFDRQ
jgi:hypothetical protein